MAFKQGFYFGSKNARYTVYECEDKGYYRLDICRYQTDYHVDPANILYSLFTFRGDTYVFGIRELYAEYQELQSSLLNQKADNNIESGMENGRFKLVSMHVVDEKHFIKTEMFDGVVDSVLYQADDRVLMLQTVSESAEMKLTPLTIQEYTKQQLAGDTGTDLPYIPLSVLEMRFDLSHVKNMDWEVVTDVEEGRKCLKEIEAAGTEEVSIGVDTETTGTDVCLYGKDRLVGVVVSIKENQSRYFAFRHKEFENLPWSFLAELMNVLMKCCKCQVAHNKKFDRQVFLKEGYDLRIRRDSFTLSMLVNPKVERGLHGEKDLEFRRTGRKFLELHDIFPNPANIDFSVLPKDIVRVYACPDPGNLHGIWDWQFSLLPESERRLLDVEMELADLKGDQEFWGFRIDYPSFEKGYKNCKYMINFLEKIIFHMTRTEFNISSSPALGDLLYNRMRCKVFVRTKTQKPSTGTLALSKLAGEKAEKPSTALKEDIVDLYGNDVIKAKKFNSARYPVVMVIQKYKEYAKLKSAFYDRVEKQMKSYYDSNVGKDSTCYRYFTWINAHGAESGRQSSNMHQMPPTLKESVCADSTCHYMIDTDYNSMELRILPSLAKEKSLIEKERDPDVDIHRAIGSILSNKEPWEISDAERKKKKRRNFGVVYMISPQGLAVQNVGANPAPSDIKEAKDSIDEFYRGLPRIAKFLRENRETVLREGKMHTLFGRTRYFPEIFDPDIDNARRASLIRQANNFPVQGTGADITKMAEVGFDRRCRERGYNKLIDTPQGKFPYCRCMLSIHDELLTSHHISQPVEEALKMIRDSMEIKIVLHDDDGSELDFAPLYAMSSVTVNWGEGHGGHYEMPRKLRDKLIDDWERTGKSAFNPSTPEELRDSILAVIKKFHEEELREYMEGIIAEVGTDPAAVANKVRHPKLTFSLLSSFGQTDSEIKEKGELPHVEHIRYAAERYLEARKNGSGKVEVETKKEREEDTGIRMDLETVVGETMEMSPFDAEGNLVLEPEDDGDSEDAGLYYSDDEEFIDYATTGETIYVWRLFDAYCIMCDSLVPRDVDRVIQLAYNQRVDDGFYRVLVYYNGKAIDTKFKVENFDTKEIEEFIKSKVSVGKGTLT